MKRQNRAARPSTTCSSSGPQGWASGPALQIQGDLTAILTNLRERQVLFLDEIHRMQPVLEEKLYTALEDYKLDIIIGQGPAARTHVMEIRPFTFIGATTRPGLLSSPLRSRFGILLRLEFYTEEELQIIVKRSAEVMQIPIDEDGASEIALRPRPTPPSPCWKSTPTASTRSTAGCCWPSSRNTTAVRSA